MEKFINLENLEGNLKQYHETVVKPLVSKATSSITVDTEMSDTSDNMVANKVIKAYVDEEIANIPTPTVDSAMNDTSDNAVSNKVIKAYVDDIIDNLPADMVVTDGELSTEDGTTYLVLTIANKDEPVKINVQELVGDVTTESTNIDFATLLNS